MKVLYIGATGLVGSHTVAILKETFDITPAALSGDFVAGIPVQNVDICDWDDIAAFVKNGTANGEKFDAIVYCATADYHHLDRTDPEAMRIYFEKCIEVNARGAFHVFEAACRAGVSRVVHIGSMTAVLGPPYYDHVTVGTPDRPNDLYSATKIFGENVGRSYAYRESTLGRTMQVICLRLGQPTVEHLPSTLRGIRSPKSCRIAADVRDIASAIECSLTTDIQYGVYPVVSAANDAFIDPALYAELGYTPQWKYSFNKWKGVEISRAS